MRRPPTARGSGRRPRRDAVVDDDDDPAGDRDARPFSTEPPGASGQLCALLCLDRGELLVCHACIAQNVFVENAGTAFSDRAHRELGLEGDTQLAHDDQLERRAEPARHFGGNGYPTSRQTDDDDVLSAEVREVPREVPTGVGPVLEPHGASPCPSRTTTTGQGAW